MGAPWIALLAGALGGAEALALRQAVRSKEYLIKAATIIFLAELFVWFIWWAFVYPHYVSPLRHLPQPKGSHWLFGQSRRLIFEPSAHPAREWVLTVPNDGLIRYLWLFNQERILVTSPKGLSEVLATDSYSYIKPPNITKMVSRLFGLGVLLSEGEEHKAQRHNLMPAFAFRHIKNLYPIFWAKSREVVEVITALCEGRDVTELTVAEWSNRCTLDIIGSAGMGRDFESVLDVDSTLVKAYTDLFTPLKPNLFFAILGTVLPVRILDQLPIEGQKEVEAGRVAIRGVCLDLIRQKKAKMTANEAPDKDILSVAIQSGQFSDEELINQVMTFLAAGHETTSSALTWAIYALCRFPHMQTRLREEIRQHLPSVDDSTGSVTSEDLASMPYLQAVCNEVLRYYPTIPQTFRLAVRDTSIMGYPIRRGTSVIVAPWATNLDPTLWGPDAAEFDPGRWLRNPAGNGGAASNYANLTFMHGARSCMGQTFTRGELGCLLAAWVGRFEFALVHEKDMDDSKLEIRRGLTARPANGLPVKVKVVNGW